MKTADNIKKVALILFLIIGIVHILSGLMFINNYYFPYSLIANRALDIPFAITAVIYAFMVIYTGLQENSQKIAKIVFVSLTILIFVFLIYINLFIPDKPSFITP